MSDPASLGVLRDLAVLVSIAITFGLVGYRLLRHFRPQAAWNHEGQVLSSPYDMPDLLALLGMGLFFMAAALLTQPGASATVPKLSETGISGLVSAMVFNLLVCLALLAYLHRLRGLNPAELFGLQQLDGRTLLRTVVFFAVIEVIGVNAFSALLESWMRGFWSAEGPQEAVQLFQGTGGVGMKVVFIFSVVILAPLVEETVFRGFVYGVLKRYTDAPFAALTSSLMFAIIHMHVGSLLPLWLLALLLCAAYEITGCLLAPILLHMIFNGVSIALMMIFGQA